MRRIKKVLSMLLAVAMLLTLAPISAVSFAAGDISIGDETGDTNTAQSDSLIRPNATVAVSPITRVAYSTAEPFKAPNGENSVIVAATPSGIARASYTYVAAAYGGETPTTTTVTFTPGAAINTDTLEITCSNSAVTFSQPVYNNGVYTWTIGEGTFAAVGTTLVFTITYEYTYTDTVTGKTYNSGKVFKSTGYSYVESVLVPAGIYTYRRTIVDYWLGQDTKNRSYFSSFVLGANTYSESAVNSGKGVDFNGGQVTTDYGNMTTYDSGTGGSSTRYNVGYAVDNNRPVSHVYMDKSANTTLNDLNLRVQTYVPTKASDSNQVTRIISSGVYEYEGSIQTFSSNDSKDRSVSNSTSTDLKLAYDSSISIQEPGETFLMSFTGNGPSLTGTSTDITKTYTMLVDYNTPASGGFSDVYMRHSFNIIVTAYDKGMLRSIIQSTQNTEPSSFLAATGTNDGKGYNPQEWYYADGWQGFISAYNYAQSILQKPNTSQSEINSATTQLQATYNSLVLKEADYTEADYYVSRANALTKSLYTTASWAKLQSALATYASGYSIIYQPKVDQMAIDIKAAIDALEYADADYTAVNEKVGIVNDLIAQTLADYGMSVSDFYSNWSVVETALSNCGYTYDSVEREYVLTTILKATEQGTVDTYPAAIQTAIDKLKKNAADYTDAVQAISEYSTFMSGDGKYITDASATSVNNAYNALSALYSQSLTIEYQSQIDEATQALRDALGNVSYKAADLTAANKAIAAADALVRSNYTDLTAVDDAYAAAGAHTGTEEQVETFKLALQLDAVKVLGIEGIGHLDAAAHLCLGRCPEGQFLCQGHAGTQPEAQGE